jgi:regulator of sigma E protease
VVEASPAWEAGLREGDEITSVNGVDVETWDAVDEVLRKKLGSETGIVIERDGVLKTLTLDLSSAQELQEVGVSPFRASVIGDVKHGGPAHAAGLRAGDRIVSIDGRPIRTWSELSDVIRSSPDTELAIVWERNGESMSSSVTPRDAGGYGLIDVFSRIEKRPVGLLESWKIGLETTVWISKQIFKLPRLLLRGMPVRDVVGGPVRISELAAESMRWGWGSFLSFIAAISAQLSLVNLLPIPVLDGGHLLLLGVETATRRPITPRQRIIAHQIGFAFLFALMILITLVDVSRFLGK